MITVLTIAAGLFVIDQVKCLFDPPPSRPESKRNDDANIYKKSRPSPFGDAGHPLEENKPPPPPEPPPLPKLENWSLWS